MFLCLEKLQGKTGVGWRGGGAGFLQPPPFLNRVNNISSRLHIHFKACQSFLPDASFNYLSEKLQCNEKLQFHKYCFNCPLVPTDNIKVSNAILFGDANSGQNSIKCCDLAAILNHHHQKTVRI